MEIIRADINKNFAVVRAAHQVLHRVDQAEMSPVFAEDIKADIRSSVLIGGVLRKESLDQVEVLVQSVDLRIACPLKNLLLDEECGSVDGVDDLLAVGQAVVRDDVEGIVAVLILCDQACLLGLDVCPQARSSLGGYIVKKVDQSAVLDKKVSAVAAVKQIRIIFTGDLHAEGLIQVACQELKLKGNAEFFFDLLIDLVVVCRLIAGIAAENSQGDGFLRFFRMNGDCRSGCQCQYQCGCQDFFHVLVLLQERFEHLCPVNWIVIWLLFHAMLLI